MKDIAKKTGLGLATISSYLNGGHVREKNRIAIEEAIKELHFEVNEVARGLKTKRTKTVGVIIPELGNIFCTDVITVMEDILRTHGYAAIVCDCRTDSRLEKEAVDFLLHKMVDGIINIPVTQDGSHLLPAVKKGKPIVLVDRKISGIECDTVMADNIGAAKLAVESLIAAGHKNIGMLSGPNGIFTAEERLIGYRLGLMEHGIVPKEDWIACGDYTMEGGRRATAKLLENRELTAVFASNYEMTVGAVIALNQQGTRIPDELAVIGFDNTDFANAVRPKLSIITQPTAEIGKTAAVLMLKRLGGDTSPFEDIRLKTQLIEGKSV